MTEKSVRKWDQTNDSPVMFVTKDETWGLVRTSLEDWELHLVKGGRSAKKVREIIGHGEEPPFGIVESDIVTYSESRDSVKWHEAEIGNRKPGSEGPGGGRTIPLQTRKARRI